MITPITDALTAIGRLLTLYTMQSYFLGAKQKINTGNDNHNKDELAKSLCFVYHIHADNLSIFGWINLIHIKLMGLYFVDKSSQQTIQHNHNRQRMSQVSGLKYYFILTLISSRRRPVYWYGPTLIPAWISKYTHYKMMDEITQSVPELQQCNIWSLGIDK